MNNLSLMLYAAEVLERFSGLLLAVAIVTIGASLISWGIRSMNAHDARQPIPKRPSGWVGLGLVAAVLCCFLPSTKTVYMMAASELGERVVTSPEGRDALALIREKVRKSLADEK